MARHKVIPGVVPVPTKLLPRDPATIARAKETVDEIVIRLGDPLLVRAYLEELIGEAEARLVSLGFPYPRT